MSILSSRDDVIKYMNKIYLVDLVWFYERISVIDLSKANYYCHRCLSLNHVIVGFSFQSNTVLCAIAVVFYFLSFKVSSPIQLLEFQFYVDFGMKSEKKTIWILIKWIHLIAIHELENSIREEKITYNGLILNYCTIQNEY